MLYAHPIFIYPAFISISTYFQMNVTATFASPCNLPAIIPSPCVLKAVLAMWGMRENKKGHFIHFKYVRTKVRYLSREERKKLTDQVSSQAIIFK